MPLATNQLLKYNGSNWTNANANVSELGDVSISSVANSQVLTYNSSISKWTNQAVSGGGGYTSGTLAIGVSLQQELTADNSIIYCDCDEFGKPLYLIVSPTSVSVTAMKVKAQTQVFNTINSIINLATTYPGSNKACYWIYADYNSGSPFIASTRVCPETYYRRTFTTGTYLNFENGLSDPFMNVWVPSTGTVTLSSSQAKFGTKSYPITVGEELLLTINGPANQDNSYLPPLPRYNPSQWMIDCFFYPTALQSTSFILSMTVGIYSTYGVILYMSNATTLGLYLSSDNASWNIANGSAVGNPVLNSWNYLGLLYDGTKYVANLNGNLVTVNNSTLITTANFIRLGAAGSPTSITGFYDDVFFTPYVRPWRTSDISPIDITTLSTYGSSYASYLTFSNNLVDSYGFNWFLNTGSITAGSSHNGVQSITLGGTQFLTTPFFPRLSLLDEWTVEGWYNCATTNTLVFASRYDNFQGLYINITNTQVIIYCGSNIGSWDIFSGSSYTFPVAGLNIWRHLAMTYSSVSGYTLYVDGVVAITTAVTIPTGVSNSVCFGRDPYSGVTSPVFLMGEFRATPWVVYTAVFTPPTTQLTVDASRDLLDTTSNTMITQGANAGTVKRLYLGMIRPRDGVANHYASTQSIMPALTSGNVKIMRDGSIVTPKNSYTLLTPNDQPYFSNFLLRNDGKVFLSKNGGVATGSSSTFLSEYNFIPNLPKIKQIAVSLTVIYLVDYSGNVYVAGTNQRGIFGDGSPINTVYTTPKVVYSGVDPVVYGVSNSYRAWTSNLHYCTFILDDGNIYATGTNDVGQLGIGSVTTPILSWTLVPKQGGNNWGGLRSNGRCSWFWSDDSSNNLLYASGFNTSAQLGIGSIINVSSPTACRYSDNSLISNVKMIGESIQSDSPACNAFLLLKTGEVYFSGRMSNAGTRLYSYSHLLTAFAGPIAYDVNSLFVSSGDDDNGILFLKNDGEVYQCGVSVTFRQPSIGVNVATPVPARYIGIYPLKNITAIKGDISSGYSFFGCISSDGKLYGGGALQTLNSNMGAPAYSTNGSTGWELDFPTSVVDTKAYGLYNGSAVDSSNQVLLADGSVYASGSANTTCNNALANTNVFTRLNI